MTARPEAGGEPAATGSAFGPDRPDCRPDFVRNSRRSRAVWARFVASAGADKERLGRGSRLSSPQSDEPSSLEPPLRRAEGVIAELLQTAEAGLIEALNERNMTD